MAAVAAFVVFGADCYLVGFAKIVGVPFAHVGLIHLIHIFPFVDAAGASWPLRFHSSDVAEMYPTKVVAVARVVFADSV